MPIPLPEGDARTAMPIGQLQNPLGKAEPRGTMQGSDERLGETPRPRHPLQVRGDRRAALKLLRKLVKRQGYLPDAVVTDRLRPIVPPCDLVLADRRVTGGGRTIGRNLSPPDPTAETPASRPPIAQLGATSPPTHASSTTKSTSGTTSHHAEYSAERSRPFEPLRLLAGARL